MHSAAVMPMAISMLVGASAHRLPLSWAKKAKKGILMPEWWNTPAEANNNTSQTSQWPSPAAAVRIKDFDTNPENSGKAEIEAAPTMQNPAVMGIDL